MNLKEKLEDLEKQLKQAEIFYFKLEGAVELTKSLIENETKKKKDKK